MTQKGHEGRFPPPGLNGRYRYRKRSEAVSDQASCPAGVYSSCITRSGMIRLNQRRKAMVIMRRRELMLLLVGAAFIDAPVGRAQEPGRVYRLGIMTGLP